MAPNQVATPTVANTNVGTDPSIDPLSGGNAPPQIIAPTVVGGVNEGAGAMILDPIGGLPSMFSIATGITSSIASKMYDNALVRNIDFSTNTVRNTILDEISFDPWSTTMVNSAALKYADLHSQFTGSAMISYEIVSNNTLLGRVAVASVPARYGADFAVTAENLYLFDHTIVDVSVGGRGAVMLKPTTDQDFIVTRDSTKFYGKVVCLSTTDIVNTFGATINVPMNVYSQLTPGSTYSAIYDAPVEPEVPTQSVFQVRRPSSPLAWVPRSQQIHSRSIKAQPKNSRSLGKPH